MGGCECTPLRSAQRGLGDANGRLRAQDDAGKAHDAKPVARPARLGGGGDGALRIKAQEVVTKR